MKLICTTLIPLVIGVCFITSLSQPERPAAEITFREMRFRKPPLVDLFFDVTLRNHSAQPTWFILPSNLHPESESPQSKGGVDGVEVFAPHGRGRVIIGHFLGTGGFYALLLPTRASVRLKSFPISFWGDPPEQVRLPLITAKRLTIGGEPAEKWFGVRPISTSMAEIAEESMNPVRMLRSRHTPDRKEVPVVIEEEARFDIQVPLTKK